MQLLQDNDDGIKLLDDGDYFKVLDFVLDSIYNINCCKEEIIEVQPVSPRLPKIRKEKMDREEQKVPKHIEEKKSAFKKDKTKNFEELSNSSIE
jgi:hypothetical protein